MSAYYYGEVTLPDGRRVTGTVYVRPDGPGPICEVVDFEFEWTDSGQPLTNAELHEDIVPGEHFLHEYAVEMILAHGEYDPNYPEATI